ncbi:acetyl-CoA synthetase-like protein [Boletus edulis BED1]|uniref:Acetyl-CoA synthetase-like protein n=1 Tax=Boletus edulis BED1 TaxID=1328754 RepID=A0AAD4GI06_BOLED|nr:acetyl-CoA synthetase-like protein [Boletus edulis BED1]
MTPDSIPPLDVSYLQNPLPDSVPVNHHPLNPISYLLRAALVYPDKLALAHPDAEQPAFYSYSVWAQRVQNLAYALIQAGIRPGDRVAVLAPNSPMIADAHFGVIAARAILTPINTRLTPLEIAYILEHSEAKLILVDHECLHLIPHTNVTTIVCHDTSKPGDPYEDFLSAGRKFSSERGWAGLDVEPNEHASAVLCYTSGTTGRPKGVITTLRGSYLAAVANAFEARINHESCYLWVLPMFHAAGWTFPWANVFACATQITIRQVDYPQIWKHLLNSGVTHYCGAPTVQIGIVNDASKQPLRNPVSAIVAGSAPTAQLISQLEQIGIKPVHTYGPFTRCYDQPTWTSLSLEDRAKLMARQGQSFATAENVRVVYPPKHEDDQELIDVPKDGSTVGEIVTRGNIVMKEYFKDPEATRKAFRGGYFNSGDLAVMHPDGVVQIMDRKKDIIISGGENASSLAIELELANHPHILEVSVVARPHPKWDERPMAFVILRPQYVQTWAGNHAAFEVELKRHARTRLPGFASPEWVQVVDKLPKTSTGKILKTDLRKIVAKL